MLSKYNHVNVKEKLAKWISDIFIPDGDFFLYQQ